VTGLGLNMRAHPLAIALANQQLDLLPSHDRYRQSYASYVVDKLSAIPFVKMPIVRNSQQDKHAWYAFVMQFDSSKAPNGLTRDEFVRRLVEDRGLKEVDIPRSTGLLNELPVFTHPHEAMPRFGSTPWCEAQPTSEFPKAESFYQRAIKLPMWATESDKPIVEHYVKEFLTVADDAMGGSLLGATKEGRRTSSDKIIQARL
jgi:dTDP-4-amino-4,6-dideoxygalactose transaminase